MRGAAAQVPAHEFLSLYARRGMPFFRASDWRHNLARRAVAALEAVVVDEGLLHGV